jgi:nucleotide-binding universal stress UspA family protein
MTYRSLLVFLDHDPLCVARTHVAIQLAKELDCHLAGVAPMGLVDVPPSQEVATPLAQYAALASATLRDHAEQAAERFRDECRKAGVTSFEADVDDADKAPSIVRHAHCSDLTVLTQADPNGHRWAQELVEQVVLHSARPTLILPRASRVDTLGTTAMVAWDDSREAARALSDALPLLRRAERVQVVSWNEAGAGDNKTLRTRLDSLHQWLAWQGVSSDARVEKTTRIDIAQAMLSRAADLNADLIVMGAYGHARWAERVLGGATRGLLASMTVPVLMSH